MIMINSFGFCFVLFSPISDPAEMILFYELIISSIKADSKKYTKSVQKEIRFIICSFLHDIIHVCVHVYTNFILRYLDKLKVLFNMLMYFS